MKKKYSGVLSNYVFLEPFVNNTFDLFFTILAFMAIYYTSLY